MLPGGKFTQTPLRRAAKVDARDYRSSQDCSGDEIDSGAIRRPPTGVGDKVHSMLPKILQPVRGEARDEEPWRTGDRHATNDHEDQSDRALYDDDVSTPIGHCETNVDRSNDTEPDSLDS